MWESRSAAENGVQHVVEGIRVIVLEMALHKAEVLTIYAPRREPPVPSPFIRVDKTDVEVQSQMKYLGLILNSL